MEEPKIRYNDQYGTPSFIGETWAPEMKKGLSKKDIAFSYLGENSKKFKLKGDMKIHFKVKEEHEDKETGTYHFRFIELFNGIPIFGAESTLALNKNENVTSFFGKVIPNIEDKNINTVVIISEEKAVEITKKGIEKQIGKVEQYDGDICVEQFIYEYDDAFYNTYLVKVSTINPKVGYWHYFIDATNGNIVDKIQSYS